VVGNHIMGWQDAVVLLIVLGAVAFLLRRSVGARIRRKRPAQSFVPLSAVKKRTDCH
jgi:hypothetical protein